MSAARTIVYIDGRNLHGWLGGEHLHAQHLAEAACSLAGKSLGAIRYFSGIVPEDHPRRRSDEGYFAHLESLGIRTILMPLERDPKTGRFAEIGVDVNIGVQMIRDYCRGTENFILLSNDEDHALQPLILAKMAKSDKRIIGFFNVTTGRKPLSALAKHIPIERSLLERFRYSRRVLDDIERFDIPQVDAPMTRPSLGPKPHGATAHIVDLQSVGMAVKRCYDKEVFNPNLLSLLHDLDTTEDRIYAKAVVVYNQHREDLYLEPYWYRELLRQDLTKNGVDVATMPFRYDRVATREYDSGIGKQITLTEQVPVSKQIHMCMLGLATTYARDPRIDTIVLMTDDRNAQKIVQSVNDITVAHGLPQKSVVHVHVDPRVQTFDGAHDFVLPIDLYDRNLETHDRYHRVAIAAAHALQGDLTGFTASLRSRYPILAKVGREYEQVTGQFLGQSKFWSAFKTGKTEITYLLKQDIQSALIQDHVYSFARNAATAYYSVREAGKDDWNGGYSEQLELIESIVDVDLAREQVREKLDSLGLAH